MRLIVLGISALALGACSFMGTDYGHTANAGMSYGHGSSHGVWHGAGHASPSPCNLNPCAAAQPAIYHPPVYHPPVYQPPVYQPPTPPAPTCQANPCGGGSYAVSPYAYSGSAYSPQPASYQTHSPSPYAYGTHAPSYSRGGYGMTAPKQDYVYGTLGAVWYDVDQAFAGLQGRVGYQSRTILGAEVEGSIGVIGEKSPFDQANPPGPNLVGEFNDSVDYSLAGFALARLPISPNISAHARAGYHTTKVSNDVTINGTDQTNSTTLEGLAYGAGLEFAMSPVSAIRADYTRYNDDVSDMDSVSLAYLRRF